VKVDFATTQPYSALIGLFFQTVFYAKQAKRFFFSSPFDRFCGSALA
jgi:hypothetical protein